MTYSLIEQEIRDIDIFFRDSQKLIHIASGGGQIPMILAENDLQNEDFATRISDFEEVFEVEINDNIREFTNIAEDGLERYLRDFVLMAKRGFYSYDKTVLGNFENPYFHLVAKPKHFNITKVSFESQRLLKIETELPSEFKSFNLFDLLEDKIK